MDALTIIFAYLEEWGFRPYFWADTSLSDSFCLYVNSVYLHSRGAKILLSLYPTLTHGVSNSVTFPLVFDLHDPDSLDNIRYAMDQISRAGG